MKFTEDKLKRYSKQIFLPGIGREGQEKINNAKVLIIGAGGLGSPCALYLASAGIGRIGIVDSDKVELSNLNRQILYSTKDIEKSKTESAKNRLASLNPDMDIKTYDLRLTSDNALNLVKIYDIVIDCSDNFTTKYLINDNCILSGRPFIYGGVSKFEGQIMTVLPGKSACLRCLFPEAPPKKCIAGCREEGVLGVVPGIIGAIQANEVLKYILNIGNLLEGKLLIFNALDSFSRTVKIPKNPTCPACN